MEGGNIKSLSHIKHLLGARTLSSFIDFNRLWDVSIFALFFFPPRRVYFPKLARITFRICIQVNKTISSYSIHPTLLSGPPQTFSHDQFTNPPSDPELVP